MGTEPSRSAGYAYAKFFSINEGVAYFNYATPKKKVSIVIFLFKNTELGQQT
jgi:hypothetical protein